MLNLKDGTLWQWDTGRKVAIKLNAGHTIDKVQFYNGVGNIAYPATSIETVDGEVLAGIPNSLLCYAKNLTVYLMTVDEDGVKTQEQVTLVVNRRAKPEDYIFTDDEFHTYQVYEERLQYLVDNVVVPEVLAEAVEEEVDKQIPGWAQEGRPDATLTESGKAADAGVTGSKFVSIQNEVAIERKRIDELLVSSGGGGIYKEVVVHQDKSLGHTVTAITNGINAMLVFNGSFGAEDKVSVTYGAADTVWDFGPLHTFVQEVTKSNGAVTKVSIEENGFSVKVSSASYTFNNECLAIYPLKNSYIPEVNDARIGIDGTVYDSLGGAIRGQLNKAADAFDEAIDNFSDNLFDVTISGASANLVYLEDCELSNVGVTATVLESKVTLSGTSTAAGSIYLPLSKEIDLMAGLPYCLSLQNFSTENAGVVVYPCNGTTPVDSTWLLSEASAMNGSGAAYTPTESVTVDTLRLHIATGRPVDNSFNVQIEQNSSMTPWVEPNEGTAVRVIKPTLYKVLNPEYVMNYLYVSNDYTEDMEGFGETLFSTIYDANESISDNSKGNRYTIIVAPGTYTDLQERYAGISDTGVNGYCGIMTKDYVYYESENIYNPAGTIIQWDGATGFDTSTLVAADIIKKCPFHLDLNVHTHIKGFTFDTKNVRYGIHLETGGSGWSSEWEVDHCIFKWGGRVDCTDYTEKTTVPVFGCGHSFGEKGIISNCKIIPTHCTVGYQNHENKDNSPFGLPIRIGANITIKNCDFGGTAIQARTIKGEYADNNQLLTIDNCINITEITETYDNTVADRCDWKVNVINQ